MDNSYNNLEHLSNIQEAAKRFTDEFKAQELAYQKRNRELAEELLERATGFRPGDMLELKLKDQEHNKYTMLGIIDPESVNLEDWMADGGDTGCSVSASIVLNGKKERIRMDLLGPDDLNFTYKDEVEEVGRVKPAEEAYIFNNEPLTEHEKNILCYLLENELKYLNKSRLMMELTDGKDSRALQEILQNASECMTLLCKFKKYDFTLNKD